ncbi:FAD-binding and (Fe-S)-binding domain-containing protein [Halomonas sabkhae]|uniref:FAD-binding and (Fe-S)-binding domain-containing protein n=1 Tax=Halomonas sabkhae TaxID=626223 RepID=UPI0025B4FD80|nr:FAD-binding and (Fe-S)-binding domain-containing protein [Halomonas sabkhae]MDN3525821.1 FAD-binding and (Fe-S)-binding domain-containing protein [Halomonas sabkhae]
MIARLDPRDASSDAHAEHYQAFLEALRAAGFAGEIAADAANRTVLATDNSIYQRLPRAVLYPRDVSDLECLASLAGQDAYRDIVMAPRGGGTGTNGQSLTDGLMIDVSRHMNTILDIDVENQRVRVQAGVVKDQLNAALKPHGLFFAPELSTSNRATIGGMIATDASGQGSREYGKTRGHVLELDSVLLGGERLASRPVSEAELDALCARKDAVGRVHRQAQAIIDNERQRIDETFPPLNRCLTGYDLAHLRTADGRFDLNSVLCGAEGSLAFTSEAVLKVLPIPRHSTLVNVRYAGFMDALRDAEALMASDAAPTSIETVDSKVLGLAKGDMVWDSVAEFFPEDGATPVDGINLVEFNDDDPERLAGRVDAFCRHLSHDTRVPRLGHSLAEGRPAIQRVYAMRKRAVGLLGNVQGEKRPIPFVEDTAVPPEVLADYIAEFRALLDSHGLEYGMFGHVDAGVLHVRPAIDMKDPAQEALIRPLSDAVAELTRRYGGLLWGEHGKGVRSEYAPAFFGPLYPSLQRLKAAFDPHNQLNPGKIATPLSIPPEDAGSAIPNDRISGAGRSEGHLPGMANVAPREGFTAPSRRPAPDTAPSTAPSTKGGVPGPSDAADAAAEAEPVKWVDPGLLTIDGVPTRGQLDRRIAPHVWQAHADAVHCNGNGACYNYDPDDAMCPSWKATRQRIHSPKGRASLMREWLRRQGEAGVDVVEEAHRHKQAGVWRFVRDFPRRARNSLARRRGEEDFSHEVHEAMAGCLACKSCASQCPVKVNVPAFRSQFLEVYHGRYLRPARDYLIGGLEFLAPSLSRLAPLYNAALGNRMLGRLLSGPLGMVDSPRLSRARLDKQLTAWGVPSATPASLSRLTAAQKARSVILVQDAFTRYFEAGVARDIIELLQRLDVNVFVAPYAANGKPMQVQGFLGAFARTAEKQAERLTALADFGVPLVGIDPAMTLTYRQEYVKTLGAEKVPEVQLLSEWLAERAERFADDMPALADPGFRLLAHCTEKTSVPEAPAQWQRIFSAFGLELEVLASGCCGMSGTYGHEARNLETSKTIYAQSWQPRVEAPELQGRLLATGYSCRSQARRLSQTGLPHPLQGLLTALQQAPEATTASRS